MYMQDDPSEHVVRHRPMKTEGQLRARLIALNLTSAGVPLLAALFLNDRLATSVFGSFTFGMLLLTAGMLTLIVAGLWYDRACRFHLAPQADEQPGLIQGSGPGAWGRP